MDLQSEVPVMQLPIVLTTLHAQDMGSQLIHMGQLSVSSGDQPMVSNPATALEEAETALPAPGRKLPSSPILHKPAAGTVASKPSRPLLNAHTLVSWCFHSLDLLVLNMASPQAFLLEGKSPPSPLSRPSPAKHLELLKGPRGPPKCTCKLATRAECSSWGLRWNRPDGPYGCSLKTDLQRSPLHPR